MKDVDALLEAVFERYGYDFRQYARSSIERRLADAPARLGCGSLAEVRERVLDDPGAFARLLSTLTVRVSDMFRDPAFFAAFRREIVPALRSHPALRLWVAGCSTGEEAYSFAIILREEGLLERTIVYATDIHAPSLEVARRGVYPLERVRSYTHNHQRSGATCSLSDHYVAAYGRAMFDPELRRHIVFADHSLATDHVFADVHVVSCRNVLIYFDAPLQARAIGLFASSLCAGGFLGIGPGESLRFVDHGRAFAAVPGVSKWFVDRRFSAYEDVRRRERQAPPGR